MNSNNRPKCEVGNRSFGAHAVADLNNKCVGCAGESDEALCGQLPDCRSGEESVVVREHIWIEEETV